MHVSGEMAIGGNGFWGNGTHSKQVVQLRLELGGASSCWAEIKSVFTNFDFKMALRMMHHQLLQMTFWKGSADTTMCPFSHRSINTACCVRTMGIVLSLDLPATNQILNIRGRHVTITQSC